MPSRLSESTVYSGGRALWIFSPFTASWPASSSMRTILLSIFAVRCAILLLSCHECCSATDNANFRFRRGLPLARFECERHLTCSPSTPVTEQYKSKCPLAPKASSQCLYAG